MPAETPGTDEMTPAFLGEGGPAPVVAEGFVVNQPGVGRSLLGEADDVDSIRPSALGEVGGQVAGHAQESSRLLVAVLREQLGRAGVPEVTRQIVVGASGGEQVVSYETDLT
jgi:hypothetical protein